MDSGDLDKAATFCKIVDASDLMSYLGLESRSTSEDARAKLRARRKFMQGMQGNPKYKEEALYLIKHFTSLDGVLEDPDQYRRDLARRTESTHLPVLEMTIRSVLAAGELQPNQLEYLRRNAEELGVGQATFDELLQRVAVELGIDLQPAPDPRPTLFRLDLEDTLPIDHAQRTPSLRTGPPARSRVVSPPATDMATIATAPPAPARSHAGHRGSLEILGDPVRTLHLGPGITVATVTIRNRGTDPMGGIVSSDAPWLVVDPSRLDPEAREQRFSIQVDRADVPDGITSGGITIRTDHGDEARIVFSVARNPAMPFSLLAGIAVAGAVILVVLVVVAVAWAT